MGDPQLATDSVSVDAFGVQSTALGWPRYDLLLINDADVLTLVQEVVAQQSDDFQGISAIAIDCDLDPVHWYQALSHLASTGIGNAATFQTRWVAPSTLEYDETVRMLGGTFDITMEGTQAKFTATLNTGRLQDSGE